MHAAVEKFARCAANFETAETVLAVDYDGKTARCVEIYNLTGCETARKAYVWQSEHSVGTAPVYKIVLGIPPINSASVAVQSTLDTNWKNVVKRLTDLD